MIDEFPFFSYYLADLHPHVLAMPFVMLVVALALNLYLRGAQGSLSAWSMGGLDQTRGVLGHISGGWGAWFFQHLGFSDLCRPVQRSLYPGARPADRLGLAAAFVRLFQNGDLAGDCRVWPVYPFLYRVFLPGRRDITQHDIFHPRGKFLDHVWVIVDPAGDLAIVAAAKHERAFCLSDWIPVRSAGRRHFMDRVVLAGHFWAEPVGVGQPGFIRGQREFYFRPGGQSQYLGLIICRFTGRLFFRSNCPRGAVTPPGNARDLDHPAAAARLYLGTAGKSQKKARVVDEVERSKTEPEDLAEVVEAEPESPVEVEETEAPVQTEADPGTGDPNGFVLLLVLVGVGLTLVPEFVYLRDQFGTRMNTIFKFYFQTWMLWGLAASFASVLIFTELRGRLAWIGKSVLLLVILLSLIYPYSGIRDRVNFPQAGNWTLDGNASLARDDPDEWSAMMWLSNAPYGIIAEAVGGSYGPAARMATHSGLPNVLGWPGHEGQWRGGGLEIGSREADISTLYRTQDWSQAQAILQRYQIRYVVVGNLERSTYAADQSKGLRALDEQKFSKNLRVAFQDGGVTIYEVSILNQAVAKEFH